MYEEEIRKILGSDKLLLGRDEVIKNVKKGKILKVYVSANCPKDLIEDLQRYSNINAFDILNTNIPNYELGTVCKKPFSISVMAVLK